MSKYEELNNKYKEQTYKRIQNQRAISNFLIELYKKLIKYFDAEPENVFIDEPGFDDREYHSCIKINFHFEDTFGDEAVMYSCTKKIEITGDYLNDQNIKYEDGTYKLTDEDINKLFDSIYSKIEKEFS